MSEVIDTKEVKEKFVSINGKESTRVFTIRAMVNNGSLFVNIRSGKNSFNISKDALPEVISQLNALVWDIKKTKETDTIKALMANMAELQKQITTLKKK
jgi:hypothetical protein